jgi:histidinol-phosphate/aromatic aminotransferase/cobyric acid decarboxylase-like protein
LPPETSPDRQSPDIHGGNREAVARRLGCRPEQILDASASLVPFGPPAALVRALKRGLSGPALRDYPDRGYHALRGALAALHGVDPAAVLPGNGAAELFTWAARDAAAAGMSLLPAPGFADYGRALACWGGSSRPLPLPLHWGAAFPQPFPIPPPDPSEPADPIEPAAALWITNPHNPTGQLWSRDSLEPLLERFALVIVDEAFLPLVPDGEQQSLIPLLADHPGLVVIRSLTKLLAIAGLRPWPVNGLAALAGAELLADGEGFARWQTRVQTWTAREGAWLAAQLATIPGLEPLPSAANFLLLRGKDSLEPLRRELEERERVLVRDCRSFEGLGGHWLRLALLDRRGNRRVLGGLRRLLRVTEGGGPL